MITCIYFSGLQTQTITIITADNIVTTTADITTVTAIIQASNTVPDELGLTRKKCNE